MSGLSLAIDLGYGGQPQKAPDCSMSTSSAEPALSVRYLVRRFLPYLYCVRWRAALAGGLDAFEPAYCRSIAMVDEVTH